MIHKNIFRNTVLNKLMQSDAKELEKVVDIIISNDNFINRLFIGVPVIKVIDEQKVIEHITKRSNREKIVSIENDINVNIEGYSEISYTYLQTKWYTEKGDDWGWRQSERYTTPKEVESFNRYSFDAYSDIIPGIEITFV